MQSRIEFQELFSKSQCLDSRAAPVALAGLSQTTFSRRRKPHAPPFDPLRRRAESLLALPDTKDELIRHYTFTKATSPSSGSGAARPIGWASGAALLPGVVSEFGK